MAMTSSLSKLAQYTSCDASDALLKLKVRNGGFVLGPTMWSPRRQEGEAKAVGPAYTVTYALVADSRPKVDKHYVRAILCTIIVHTARAKAQIDGIPPGAVVFISGPEVPNCFYGGLMSTRAQASGAVGTVVIGRIRDLQEHRDLDFPVSADSDLH